MYLYLFPEARVALVDGDVVVLLSDVDLIAQLHNKLLVLADLHVELGHVLLMRRFHLFPLSDLRFQLASQLHHLGNNRKHSNKCLCFKHSKKQLPLQLNFSKKSQV